LTRGAGSNLGGGIFATGGALTIDGSTIESCIGGSGAAVYAASVEQLTVTNSQLRQNLASSSGGAFLLTNTPFTIRDCLFEHNNQAPPATIYPARGGSVHATASGGVVEDCTFRDEWAEIGGAWFQAGAAVVARRCVFQNTRSDLQGGAVYIELSGLFRAENCRFVDGRAKFGAGVAAAFGARFELDHCTLARGNASVSGGALYLETASIGTVSNSILCLATRSDLVACAAANVAFANCDIWNDDAQNARAEFAPDCENPIGTAGNFSANPQFCDASGTELRLAPGSPCVGAGSDGSDLGWTAAGCPAGIPLSVVPESWSRIKSRYRTGSEVLSTPD
jgi:hypothetical protein